MKAEGFGSFNVLRTESTMGTSFSCSPKACSYILQGYCGLFGAGPVWESERVCERALHLKQNPETTEDDTLMGTDVCSNVICRLMEFGDRCGRDSSTLTCVHDNANCGHQIPLIRADRGPEPVLKYCQLHQSFGLRFPTGWWNGFDISSIDNQGFTVPQYGLGYWCYNSSSLLHYHLMIKEQPVPSFCANHGQHLNALL